ncbi:hypothetical protein HID58_052549, partial [Brassica napus]
RDHQKCRRHVSQTLGESTQVKDRQKYRIRRKRPREVQILYMCRCDKVEVRDLKAGGIGSDAKQIDDKHTWSSLSNTSTSSSIWTDESPSTAEIVLKIMVIHPKEMCSLIKALMELHSYGGRREILSLGLSQRLERKPCVHDLFGKEKPAAVFVAGIVSQKQMSKFSESKMLAEQMADSNRKGFPERLAYVQGAADGSKPFLKRINFLSAEKNRSCSAPRDAMVKK